MLNPLTYNPGELKPNPPWFLIRWTVGFAIIVEYIKILPWFDLAFSPWGAASSYSLRQFEALTIFGGGGVPFLGWLRFVESPFWAYLTCCVLFASVIMMIVGIAPRISGAVLLIAHCSFTARNEFFFWGWGELLKVFVLYGVFCPGFSQGVKSFFKDGPSQIPRWPTDLLKFHCGLVYFVAAISRLDSEAWWDGTAIFYILGDYHFSRFPEIMTLGWNSALKASARLLWMIELSAPVGLFFRDTRTVWVLLLIGMHISLEILSMVGWWNYIMAAVLINCLDPIWIWSKTKNFWSASSAIFIGHDKKATKPSRKQSQGLPKNKEV